MKSASDFFERSSNPKTGTCFVLMPYAESMTAVWEHGIKPLVESMNIQCRRADEMYTSQGILGDIWESMQSAEFVIADLTGKNPNVMYELGLCHALWKRVILLSQNKDDVPFDLRQWRVLWYDFTFEGAKRLEEELRRAIEAIRKEPHIESNLVPLNVSRGVVEPAAPASDVRESNSDWMRGVVKTWKTVEGFGFIQSGDEDFYFNRDYLFSDDTEPQQGDKVLFVAMEAIEQGKNRRASNVFVIGGVLHGVVTRIVQGKGFGFADVDGQRGQRHNLFVLTGSDDSLTTGAAMSCVVGANDMGPIGEDVVLEDAEEEEPNA